MRSLLALVCFSLSSVALAERPNVLVLLSDDQRFDTIRALGNDEIQTPNLDRLVREGFAFTHAHGMGSMQPAVCVPSRAMLLSGRTLFRAPADLARLPLLPEMFGQAGYATFGVGKWHNGPASYARAFQGGSTIFFGGMSDQRQLPFFDFDPSGKYAAAKGLIGEGFSTELFADAAVRFLKAHKGDLPFFLYVAFTSPHDPRTAPKEFADLYDPRKLRLPANFLPLHPFNNGELKVRDERLAPWPRTEDVVLRHLADYYGMISHLDAQVGRILRTLEETGQLANTLIVFASDNGLAVGRHGLFGKQNLYDHSVRVPLVLRGPGIPRGQRSGALCYLLDVFPTLCDLCGVAAPKEVEGQSLAPVIAGRKVKVRESVFCAYREFQRSVRTDRWKLIRYPHINTSQLFDLEHDPDERHDLGQDPQHAQRVQEMLTLLSDWQARLDDPQPLSTDSPLPLTIDLTQPDEQ